MKHRKTSFAILFGLLSLSLAISGSASWIITSPTINGGPSNIREDNSVCYIQETGYYYSSLEGAIKDANEYVGGKPNATIIVIPNKTIYINNDTTLQSGVDLLMPYTTDYSTTLDGNNTRVKLPAPEMTEIRKGDDGLYIAKYLYTSGGNNYPKEEPYKNLAEYDTALSDFADANGSTNKISSTLIIDENVELTISNNSQMVIYGQLGKPGTNLNGHTSGYYSQVILLNGAKINVDVGGILDVRGYIKEANNVNEALNYTQIINNGTIYVPFVVYDYGGGTATIAIYAHGNECPFSQYDMPNIHSTITTQNSGAIKARADLYTGYQDLNPTIDNSSLGSLIRLAFESKGIKEEDLKFYPQQNVCFVDVVGNSDKNILKTTANSIVITKYNPSNRSPITVDGKSYNIGNTNNISKTAVSTDGLATTTIKAYGDINIGYLTLNVSIFEQIVPISTQNIYFPIPWQMNVNFYNGKVTISNMVKLLPGAQVRFTNCQIDLIKSVIAYNKTSWTETTKTYNTQQDSIVELNYSTLNIAAGASFGGYITLNQSSIENSSNYTPSIISVDSLSSVNASTTESEGGSMSLGDLMSSGGNLFTAFENLADFMKGNKPFDDDIKNLVGSAFKTKVSNNVSLNAQTDFNSKGNKINIESGYKYISEDRLDYFNDIGLVVDKVLSVTLKTASGKTESNWSEFNDQIIATINPAAAREYTVEWTTDNNTEATLSPDTDNNPLIRNINIEKCEVDNGSYTATVTIKITNKLDDSSVSNSITLTSYGPKTTIQFVETNFTVEGDSYNQPVKVRVETDRELSDLSLVWTLSSSEYSKLSETTPLDENGEASAMLSITGEREELRSVELTVTVIFNNTNLDYITQTFTSDCRCLLPDTLITMADGSYKQVKDITSGDEVMVFNHETGQIDTAPIFFNDYDEKAWYDVINLQFDNGKDIGVIYEHGFFDLTLNKYVYITHDNYKDFIGHEFYTNVNNTRGSTTLVNAYIDKQYTEVYSPVSYYHLNYFTEDVLSMPGATEYFVNIFPYDNNLKYDEVAKLEYISQYGLYTYDDFKNYVPFEFYNAFPAQYLKIQVEKGIISFDDILRLIDRYKEYL